MMIAFERKGANRAVASIDVPGDVLWMRGHDEL